MTDEQLLQEATAMLDRAYVPYSHFRVGAAVVGNSGKVYTGCNIENVSFGATNCAERTAIFKGISEGETGFRKILVTGDTDEPIAPCGICRQVMVEFFEPRAEVILTNQKGDMTRTTLEKVLPGSFASLN